MSDEINFFAETNFRGAKVKFGIKTPDRRRHFYVIGKTGMGKTTLLENMAIQDIQAGRGICIVDPHGEFAEKMLDFVPSHRINDVIYFNPADLDFPIAFNVIEKVDSEHRHLVASGLVGVFKKLWAESWGPRLEYVLRNAILALLEYPGSTLLGTMRILTDKEYRKKVVEKISDPVVKAFWVDEFAKYPDRFMAEAVAPIQNKVGQFLTSPVIRNIVGQTTSSVDIREVMDLQKILIVNLSKGRVGEDNSALLGAMLITRLQLAAMSRVDIPESERKDFYLYVDEFQNFATESFATILSEARKYRLDLVLAHQYITQMSEEVRDAVFGNVGSTITFRIGAADAEFMEKEFMPEFMVNDLVSLGFAQTYLKLMIDGVASRPFSATTLPPIQKPEFSYRDKIIKISRERYSTDRHEVEEKIARWSGVVPDEERVRMSADGNFASIRPSSPRNFVANDRTDDTPMYDAVCVNCGKQVQLKFKPDGVRPVYCRDCLIKVREQKEGGVLPSQPKQSVQPRMAPQPSAPSKSMPQQRPAYDDRPARPMGRPQSFRPSSEVMVRDTGAPVSLAAAAKNAPSKFTDNRRKKKEVNLSELRETLNEVMAQKEPEHEEEKPKAEPFIQAPTLPPVPGEDENKGNDEEGDLLKPGQTVEL